MEEIVNSEESLTAAEIKFCEYQKGMTGDFYTKLIGAMFIADSDNQELLGKGYSKLMKVVLMYRVEEGYWINLKEKWNKIYPNSMFAI